MSLFSRAGELRRLNADCVLTCRRVPLTQRKMRMTVYIYILTCRMVPLTHFSGSGKTTFACMIARLYEIEMNRKGLFSISNKNADEYLHLSSRSGQTRYYLAESAFPTNCTSKMDGYQNFLRCVAHPPTLRVSKMPRKTMMVEESSDGAANHCVLNVTPLLRKTKNIESIVR